MDEAEGSRPDLVAKQGEVSSLFYQLGENSHSN
jgi:hypothetical protein